MTQGLSDDELKAVIDSELRNSQGYWGGKLPEQRRKAEYYYLGLAKGDLAPPEVDGRSTVVVPRVRNTIEAMMPALMMKFCSGDSVVEFEATKEGDEEKADSVTQYLNYLFFKKNNGHRIVETWVKDALLSKRGILKVYWDKRHEEKREEYKGLSDVELAQILDDEEVEPVEHSQYPDEDDAEKRQQALDQLGQQLAACDQAAQMGDPQAQAQCQQLQAQIDQINAAPPVMLHDVTVKRVKTDGKLTLENVPPDEFLISRKAKDIATSPFVAHRVMRTISELRSMGYKNLDQIGSDEGAAVWNAERVERVSYSDEYAYINADTPSMDESQRLVWITEAYIRADRDGDGIAELLKVTKAGNAILDEEVVDCAPFVSICPITIPHSFWGFSVADLALESQRIETSIIRASLDNLWLQVNGRYFAVEGQVNLDDLLTSRPGGVVRIKQQGAVGRLDQAAGDSNAVAGMIEYMQQFNEDSTGWTRYSAGLDADSLNQTATGANLITNKADLRTDLIARNFAEGFVELFRMMLKLVLQNQDKEAMIRLNGKWVNIDPREWRNQFDVSINVGLGTGSKDQRVQHLMLLGNIQEKALTGGLPIADAETAYNTAVELVKELGFKNGNGRFFKNPREVPPQQPKSDPSLQIEAMKQQGEQQKIAAQLQLEREKTQLEMQQAQFAAHSEEAKKDAELRLQTQLELIKASHQKELEAFKIQAQQDIDWRKAQLEAETKILVAQIGAQTKERESPLDDSSESKEEPNNNTVLAAAIQGFQAALERLGQPRQIVRGPDGRASGIV